MRPRRLELTAFGPYPGSICLDFDTLAAEGLFVIFGPMGSGKTFLLDAMTYALYGTVPGERQPDRLRSDHADPREQTAVAFEFCVRGDDYRITRVPPHQRAKKTGTGTTFQKPKATLARRGAGGTWAVLGEGVEEVGAAVVDLLGLNARQFTQVVLLPQGLFAKALRAKPDERSALLSSLFGTERFARYAGRLAERARTAEQTAAETLATLSRARDAAVRRAADVLGLTPDPDADVRALAAGVAAEAAEAEQAVSAATAAARSARADCEQANAALRAWQRRAEALTTLACLQADADQRDADRRRLDAALRAQPCRPLLAATADATLAVAAGRRDRVRSLERLARAVATLPESLRPEVDDAGLDDAAGVHRLRDAVRDLGGDVAAAVRSYDEWAQADAGAAAALQAAADRRAQSAELTRQAEAVEEQRAQLEAARDEASSAAARLDTRRAEADRLHRVAAAAARLGDLQRAADRAAERHRRAREAAVAALTAQQELVQRRLAGMAGELAAGLVAGEPCAVCGAVEHPDPAVPADDAVSTDRIDAAAAASQAALEEAERCREDAEQAAAALQEVSARCDGADDPAAAAERARVAGDALADDERTAAGVAAAQQRVREAAELVTAARRRAADLDTEAASAAARADALTDTAAVAADEVRAVLGQLADPRPVQAGLAAVLAATDGLCAAVEAEHRAGEELRSHGRALAEVLAGQGFADADEAAAAVLDDDEIGALEQRLADADRRRAEAEAVLADAGAGAATERPDVSAAEATAAAADDDAAAAHRRHEVLLLAARDLAGTADECDALAGALAPQQERAERLRRLADVCSGSGNSLRMSLERYVLAAYLEEITDAASVRLRAMTDGRYSLRHSDARVRGGGASGLSIVVQDAYTGTERETGTLSGGETFCASLALALAVADVAQHHAGGVVVDTLFVDEGFGSLDAQALDQALAELERLREGGRLVGVISHVATLRERIAAGIEVHRTPTGSDARVVTLAGL